MGLRDYKDIMLINMSEIIPNRLKKVEFVVCEEAEISVDQLYNGGRQKEYSEPRQLVWAIVNLYLGYTSVRIGRIYKKDHSTILHGVEKMKNTEDLAYAVMHIEEKFPGVLPKSSVLMVSKKWPEVGENSVEK